MTGASGFIGQHAVRALARRGFDVHAVSRHPHSPLREETLQWHVADLSDRTAVVSLVSRIHATHLLHLAWDTSPGTYYASPGNVGWLNDSTELCRAFIAAGGTRIVAAGTSAEYDLGTRRPLSERTTPLHPNGLYGKCKKALYENLESMGRDAGVEVAWGRVFFCYGPGEHPSRTIPKALLAILQGKRVPFPPAEGLRDYLHVRDVADAFTTLVTSPFVGAVNVGSGYAVRLRDVIGRLAELAGRPDAVEFGALEPQPHEPDLVVANMSRMRKDVGWQSKIPLDEGLAETVAWWRNRVSGTAGHHPMAGHEGRFPDG